MTLALSIDHRLGAFHLRAKFACHGRLTALFGPSGSGKTSVVNAIAGLLKPDVAHIVADGDTLADTQNGVWIPPHRRQIGYVFQEPRLFPHMSVRQNLTYAQRFGGRSGRPGASFETIVEMLGIGPLLQRHPSLLSGGEKQRVAIGRALLSHPRLLLMDEPLASLDEGRKQDILPFIERLRDEALAPIIYVSHSLEEVGRLADSVVVMEGGAVVSSGPPQSALAGAQLLHGFRNGGDVNTLVVHETKQLAGGQRALHTPAGVFIAPPGKQSITRIAIDTADIVMTVDDPGATSAPAVLSGRVRSIASGGDEYACRVAVRVGDAELLVRTTASFVQASTLCENAPVYLLMTRLQFS